MIPGVNGGRYKSSDESNIIDLLDSKDQIQKKLKKAFCEPGDIENNGILAFVIYVIFPYLRGKSKVEFHVY